MLSKNMSVKALYKSINWYDLPKKGGKLANRNTTIRERYELHQTKLAQLNNQSDFPF